MSYNAIILKQLEAEKYLAVLLEKSINEAGREALKQVQLITTGFKRLTWYSSCLFDNYQDVCSKLKNEDLRFLKALVQLAKRHDVIGDMIEIFVNDFVSGLSDESINTIERIIAKSGAHFSSTSVTNRSFGYAISSAICFSIEMKFSIESTLSKYSIRGAAVFGAYGYVQFAAEAAERLKKLSLTSYYALYTIELEMLYFIIEPIVNSLDVRFKHMLTDEEIANTLLSLLR